jgi:endonuclease V-like protein UPF0215 family
MPITTKVVSLNPAHGEMYLIQHYVTKFVDDIRQVVVFSGYSVSFTNKTDIYDITEILLKVVLHTMKKKPKGKSESVYRRRTDNTMAKRKRTKGQTTIYKAYI